VSSSSHAFFPSMERDSAMRAKARCRGVCVGVLAVVLEVVVREDKSPTVQHGRRHDFEPNLTYARHGTSVILR
jgi:hypothetical protein